MKTLKNIMRDPLILLEDLKAGDIILVRLKINSKKAPYTPFKLTSTIPDLNGHRFPVLSGHWLTPEGEITTGSYSAACRIKEYKNECYVVAKPITNDWYKNELKKAQDQLEEIETKRDWLFNMSVETTKGN